MKPVTLSAIRAPSGASSNIARLIGCRYPAGFLVLDMAVLDCEFLHNGAPDRGCYCRPMSIDVRAIRDDELLPWLDSLSTAFLDRPDLAKIAEDVRPH